MLRRILRALRALRTYETPHLLENEPAMNLTPLREWPTRYSLHDYGYDA